MNSVFRVKNISIGEGKPKICIPLTSSSKQELIQEMKTIPSMKADLVEWRGDLFQDIEDEQAVEEILIEFQQILPDIPILFTFRTHEEGGAREITLDKYKKINRSVIQSKRVDMIDVELYRGEDTVKELVSLAHQYNQKVIISNHDFRKTPPQSEMEARLHIAANYGADIVKIAVMPKDMQDVLTLLSATNQVSESISTPVITMSMGVNGVISRLAGEVFGSAMTFAAGKTASAPGQIDSEKLRTTLEIIHESISK